MQVLSFSEKGKRPTNEDYVLSKVLNEFSSIHLIADGMGGYEHGELAAKTVANTIAEYIQEHLNVNANTEAIIKNAINHSNHAIQKLRTDYNSKMGSTLAGILIYKHQAYCFWVGDVRIYHIRENKIIFQSKDHSLINELLNKDQTLTPSEIEKYRHIVTKSIQGEKEDLRPEIIINNFTEHDSFIICSDGVHNVLSFSDFEISGQFYTNTDQSLNLIKDKCMKESGDNYSMILIAPK